MVKTLKELNARVDRLHDQFQRNFEEIKRSLSVSENEDPGESSSSVNNKEECRRKLLQLEVDFMNEIGQIRSIIEQMEEKLATVQNRQRKGEMFTNRKSIVLHGLEENTNSSISMYKLVIEFFMNNLNKEVKKDDISVIYRVGRKKETEKKPRPLIVEFCCQWLRDEIYYSKKALKGRSSFMTEKLTEDNLKMFKEVRKMMGDSCWTKGGIIYIAEDGRKSVIKTSEDVNSLKQKLQNQQNIHSQDK